MIDIVNDIIDNILEFKPEKLTITDDASKSVNSNEKHLIVNVYSLDYFDLDHKWDS